MSEQRPGTEVLVRHQDVELCLDALRIRRTPDSGGLDENHLSALTVVTQGMVECRDLIRESIGLDPSKRVRAAAFEFKPDVYRQFVFALPESLRDDQIYSALGWVAEELELVGEGIIPDPDRKGAKLGVTALSFLGKLEPKLPRYLDTQLAAA
jgi:hypothetical protein